jgi:hypothetical protein
MLSAAQVPAQVKEIAEGSMGTQNRWACLTDLNRLIPRRLKTYIDHFTVLVCGSSPILSTSGG